MYQLVQFAIEVLKVHLAEESLAYIPAPTVDHANLLQYPAQIPPRR